MDVIPGTLLLSSYLHQEQIGAQLLARLINIYTQSRCSRRCITQDLTTFSVFIHPPSIYPPIVEKNTLFIHAHSLTNNLHPKSQRSNARAPLTNLSSARAIPIKKERKKNPASVTHTPVRYIRTYVSALEKKAGRRARRVISPSIEFIFAYTYRYYIHT